MLKAFAKGFGFVTGMAVGLILISAVVEVIDERN